MRQTLLGLVAGVLALGGLAWSAAPARADHHDWHGRGWHHDRDDWRHGWSHYRYRPWYGGSYYTPYYGGSYYAPYRSYYYAPYPTYYYGGYGFGYQGPRFGVYVTP